MDEAQLQEAIGRFGPRHGAWVSLMARTADDAAATSDTVIAWFDELLVEAAMVTPWLPDDLLASLRRSAAIAWPRLSRRDMPGLEAMFDDDRTPGVCAEYDPIRNVVEIDLVALVRRALLLEHRALSDGDLASAVAIDPCYVAARSVIPAALASPPGRIVVHELVHAATPRELRPYDLATDGPITPSSFAAARVLQRPFLKELVAQDGSGLIPLSRRYGPALTIAEATTETRTRRLWPLVADAFDADFASETPSEIRGGLEAYQAWHLVDALFPGHELDELFTTDATLEVVLARVEPMLAPERCRLLERYLDGAMTAEDEKSHDGLALLGAGWEAVAAWIAA